MNSRFVLGDDRRWVLVSEWGGERLSNARGPKKIPTLVDDFRGDRNWLWKQTLVRGMERSMRTDMIRIWQKLGFIEELDRIHGVLGWIFEQDGVPCHTLQKAT